MRYFFKLRLITPLVRSPYYSPKGVHCVWVEHLARSFGATYFWQFPAMPIFLPSSQTSWTSHSANGTGNSKLIWPWTFQTFSECFQIFVFSYFPSKFFQIKQKCNFQQLDGNWNVWNDFDVDDYGLSGGFIPIRPVKN